MDEQAKKSLVKQHYPSSRQNHNFLVISPSCLRRVTYFYKFKRTYRRISTKPLGSNFL